MTAARPREAATVILIRPRPGAGFEVFMTQRPSGMDFLGGYYVFPGGTLRREDSSASILARCYGLSAKQAQKPLGGTLSPELSLAHWIAAIRELYEEVGVLLGVNEGGSPLHVSDEKQMASLAEKRERLLTGALTFAEILESEGLFCHAAALSYFSHWLTPESYPVRFDTRFYLAVLPGDQEPLPRSKEVAQSLWIAPEEGLERCREGSLPLIFPTFASLRALADVDSLEALRQRYGLKSL